MTTPVKEEGTPWEIHDVVDLYWSKLAHAELTRRFLVTFGRFKRRYLNR